MSVLKRSFDKPNLDCQKAILRFDIYKILGVIKMIKSIIKDYLQIGKEIDENRKEQKKRMKQFEVKRSQTLRSMNDRNKRHQELKGRINSIIKTQI